VYTCILCDDFYNLLKLLLSMQIGKPEPGSYDHNARAAPMDPSSDALNEVTDVVMRRFKSSDKSDVDWETFKYVSNTYMVRFLCILDFFELIIKPRSPKIGIFSTKSTLSSQPSYLHRSL